MRCSLYIEGAAGERALIDTAPEFRLQALEAGITGLDAVFLTHAHADHLHGLDDIRPLSREKPVPVYGNEEVIGELRERFSYIFRPTQEGGGKPRIETTAAAGPVRLGALVFIPIPLKHGILDILGWKISEQAGPEGPGGNAPRPCAAYLTDTSCISEASFRLIGTGGKPELLIIGGLRERPHETHFNFEQALEAAVRIGAKRVYLTHLCHSHFHREIEDYCGKFARRQGLNGISMGPAWDGLEAEL
jgi:phosphoribosyl 1,2-cyclic phosphate phosphodiesterase